MTLVVGATPLTKYEREALQPQQPQGPMRVEDFYFWRAHFIFVRYNFFHASWSEVPNLAFDQKCNVQGGGVFAHLEGVPVTEGSRAMLLIHGNADLDRNGYCVTHLNRTPKVSR